MLHYCLKCGKYWDCQMPLDKINHTFELSPEEEKEYIATDEDCGHPRVVICHPCYKLQK